MRDVNGPAIAKFQSGRYKIIIWGQHPDHVMDWAGCNYRAIVFRPQPKKGFPTVKEAQFWWTGITPGLARLEFERAVDEETVGTHLSNNPRIGMHIEFDAEIKWSWDGEFDPTGTGGDPSQNSPAVPG